MKNIFRLVGVILLFTILACNGNETDSGSNSPIDSEITMFMIETLNPAERTLRINAQTERIYGCSNFSIANEFSNNGKTIALSFTSVIQPSVCLTALGPATAVIDLGAFVLGEYHFPIKVNDEITAATLMVTDTSYQIANGNGRWTNFPTAVLLKVPTGTIWGNIQYSDNNLLRVYQTFIDSLASIGAQHHNYPVGNYGHFQLDAASEVAPPPPPHPSFVKTFIYYYNLDMLKIRVLVKSFAKTYGKSMAFNLYGSNGEVYLSSELMQEP